MEVLILMTSHFKPSGHNHLQDIRPYFENPKTGVFLCPSDFWAPYAIVGDGRR
jgi:hypothetical protein